MIETWLIDGPQVIDIESIESLDAAILNGRVDVIAHEDPARTDTRVEVHAVVGRPVEVRVEEGALRIGYEQRGWKSVVQRIQGYSSRDVVEVHVAVPPTVSVRLSTVRGEILVAGAHRGVRATTLSGSVITTATRGELHVDTVSGEVSASEHEGAISMDSVSGELTATGTLAAVALDSLTGSVTLDTHVTPTSVTVNAVSADILVRLPDPDAMAYEVHGANGRLLVDGVEYRGSAISARTGPEEDTRPVLKVSAVTGNVAILRAGDAADEGTRRDPAFGTPPEPSDASPTDVVDEATSDEGES